MLVIAGGEGTLPIEVPKLVVIFLALIPLLVSLTFYVFRAIGVSVLSKKAGVKQYRLAWVPFLWIYPLAKALKNERFIFNTYSKLAFWLTFAFTLAGVITFAYNFLTFFPLAGYYLQGGEVVIKETIDGLTIIPGQNFLNPFDRPFLNAVKTFLGFLCGANNGIIGLTEIVSAVITIFMYFAVFRRYWPQNYIWASILSVVGIFPIMIFIIRKRKPLSYQEFIRERMGRFSNPYGPNPYGTPNNRPNEQPSPFSEYETPKKKDEDPFPEFSDKDKR